MKILVTGCAGFVGSAFIRRGLTNSDHVFVGLARNSDQRNLLRLPPQGERLRLVFGDLSGEISGLCEHVDAVVHFAAKTFVDHSIKDASPFVRSNVLGTMNILEDAKRYKVKRFIHISTDEVYGAILQGAYKEDARLNPTNPYSAAKAGADCLTISYAHTYGLHTTVTRTENNYGEWQHPQKAMPVFVSKALKDQPIPVYGDGLHVRQWLYVSDHVDAIFRLLETDYPPGEVFHVAGRQELTNIELARKVLDILGKPHSLITLVPDHDVRPGHDRRYALDCSKLESLGWKAKVSLDEGLNQTVGWYASNPWWLA